MSRKLYPVDEPYSDEVAGILETYPKRDGYILQVFRVFANSSRFLRKGVLNLLDRESPLSLRHREIVILRVTANLECEYEWGVHVTAFQDAGGFTPRQIAATRNSDASEDCWSEEEKVLIEVVDGFCSAGKLCEKTRAAFERLWSLEQQLEIMALCGNYHTVSFVANTARLSLEPFAARFPEGEYQERRHG